MDELTRFLLNNSVTIRALGGLFFLLILAIIADRLQKHSRALEDVAYEIRELRRTVAANMRNNESKDS